MWALVILRSQSDAFLFRKIPRIFLGSLSAQSPCSGLYLAHLWKEKSQTCERSCHSDSAAVTQQAWLWWVTGASPSTPQARGPLLEASKTREKEVVIFTSSRGSTLTALTESVNMLSCRCNEVSDCWKEKKKRVMDQCHLRIRSQQTWAVCSCLASLHLPEVRVLPFDSFYPFKQQAAHKIKSTEPQLRLEADIL